MAVKKQPARQCVGCRELKLKKELIRVVKTEDSICVDLSGRKNGRGAYLCRNTACLEKAWKSKGLEKSLKTRVPEEVYESLREEMKEIE